MFSQNGHVPDARKGLVVTAICRPLSRTNTPTVFHLFFFHPLFLRRKSTPESCIRVGDFLARLLKRIPGAAWSSATQCYQGKCLPRSFGDILFVPPLTVLLISVRCETFVASLL